MEKSLFIIVLEENKETIFRMCKAWSDGYDDAKDLFQEVLIHIWQALPSFQNKSALSTWIYRITINVCLRAKQKDVKRKKMFFSAAGAKLESLDISYPQQETYNELYACIQKLNDTDKSLIMLYLEDLSYKEIAAVTGLNDNHIAVKIMRIKKKLFQCLKP